MRSVFTRHFIMGFAVLMGILQVSASASIVDNAPSWRGNAGTTYAAWEFNTSSKTPVWNYGANEYGDVSIYVQPKQGDPWKSQWEGRYGVWMLSGTITADIPNSPVTGPGTSKQVRIQLIWKPEVGYEQTVPEIDMQTSYDEYCDYLSEGIGSIGILSNVAMGNGWNYTTYLIDWPYNPTGEVITIHGEIAVDQLVIDTICIPEPTTLAIMGFGMVAMWRLRKK